MTGIISGQGQKLIAINNMPDHFHILVGAKAEHRAFRFGSGHKGWIIWLHQCYKDYAPTELWHDF